MARPISAARFERLIRVATQIFIRRGYRQAQMAEVAKLLGVAKGTLYAYVESKDALFDAAIRHADQRDEVPTPATLPIKTPLPGTTVGYVRERLTREVADMALSNIVQGKLVIDDPEQELGTILGDLYTRLARNRHAIKLVDRCATDYPELAELWFGQGRWAQHQLLVTLLETVAFWALHRHFDPSPQVVDDAQAQRVVIQLLARGLLKTSS